MADAATIQARLAEARRALNLAIAGQTVESIDYEGRRVRYSPTDVPALRAYIADLEIQSGVRKSRVRALGMTVR